MQQYVPDPRPRTAPPADGPGWDTLEAREQEARHLVHPRIQTLAIWTRAAGELPGAMPGPIVASSYN